MYYTMNSYFMQVETLSFFLYLCYLYSGDFMVKISTLIIEWTKKNYKILIRSLFVLTIFWYSVFFQWIPVWIFHLNRESITPTVQVYLSVFASVILFSIYCFLYWKDLKKEFKIFKKNLIENLDAGVRWWLLGLFIMVISNLVITFFLKDGGAANEKTVQTMLKYAPSLMLIEAGFIAPFNEEIVFRKALKDVFSNKWLFAFLSFLLFGGGHVFSNIKAITDYLYIIPYGALGATFALAYDETDTVFTSLTMHILHNTALVILSLFVLK